MQHFYLADEKHKSVKGDVVELKGLLYFRQDRSGYDGKATAEHVKGYPIEFQAFKSANPDYVVPDSLVDIEIGSPLSAPQVKEPAKSELNSEMEAAEAVAEQPEEPAVTGRRRK